MQYFQFLFLPQDGLLEVKGVILEVFLYFDEVLGVVIVTLEWLFVVGLVLGDRLGRVGQTGGGLIGDVVHIVE